MTGYRVAWRGGVWSIETASGVQYVVSGDDGRALDAWLTGQGERSRRRLDFGGSRALEQRFVHDFGPITGR